VLWKRGRMTNGLFGFRVYGRMVGLDVLMSKPFKLLLVGILMSLICF